MKVNTNHMNFSAKQIAELVEGEVVGNPDVEISNVSKIEEGKPGTISFLSNTKYTKYIYDTEASVVIVNNDFIPDEPVKCTLIKVEDAYSSVAKLMRMYTEMMPKKTGIEQPSFISESATVGDFAYVGAFAYIGDNVTIGDNVSIYPNTYIGDNVTIGDNCTLYAGVKIYKDCKVGNNCILHAGAVVGSDGFGFAPNQNNEFDKIPQLGNVVIEDNCEIGANTTIDRATMGSTLIQQGVKLDNLVQVAHNVVFGKNTVMAALSGVAGSSKIGENCMFGGHTAVAGHLTVANRTNVAGISGVSGNVKKEGTVIKGSAAFDLRSFNRSYVNFKRLPEMAEELKSLKEEIKKLKGE